MAVNHIRPIIPPSLQFNFLRSCMANSSSWSSSNSDIRYCDDLWIERIINGVVEYMTGIHSVFVINVIKGRYVIFLSSYVCCEIIIEAVNSDSFRESPDSNKLLLVVPLNPIAKTFPTIINRHPHSNISTKPYPTTLCHPELLKNNIRLKWLVVWVHFINRIKTLRHEKRMINRANWDIRTLVRILQ